MFTEPIQWLFYAFFQPSKLRSSFKSLSFTERIVHCLRLYFPFLFLCYLLATVVELSVSAVAPVLAQTINHPLLAIIPSVAIFMVIGILVSIVIDAPLGIAISLAMSIAASFTWPIILGVCIGALLAATASYNTYYINTLLMVVIALLTTGIHVSVFSVTISFLETIMLLFFVVAGILRATAFGNERKIRTSNSAIGGGVVISAIFSFLIIINTHNIILNIIFDVLGIFTLVFLCSQVYYGPYHLVMKENRLHLQWLVSLELLVYL